MRPIALALFCALALSPSADAGHDRVYAHPTGDTGAVSRPVEMRLITLHDSFREGHYEMFVEARYPRRRKATLHRMSHRLRRSPDGMALIVETHSGGQVVVADILPASLERRHEEYRLRESVELEYGAGWISLRYDPARTSGPVVAD